MSEFVTEAFTLLGVAIVIIALRTTARWIMVGPKNFQPDDYLMLVACVSVVRSAVNLADGQSGGIWTGNSRRVCSGSVVSRCRQQRNDG